MSGLRVMRDEHGQYWVVRVTERNGEPARHRPVLGPFTTKAAADAGLREATRWLISAYVIGFGGACVGFAVMTISLWWPR